MAEAVQAFLLSHYLNSADALVEETVRQQAAEEDDEQQRRNGQPDGARRSSAHQPERLPRTHSVRTDDDAIGRFSRNNSRRVLPFTNEYPSSLDTSSPIMRRASWVEAPLTSQEGTSSGFGLPRTPLRVLSMGHGLQPLPPALQQQDLPQHLLVTLGQDHSEAGASGAGAPISPALLSVRSVRGAWGPVQSVRHRFTGPGVFRSRPSVSGGVGSNSPVSPKVPQRRSLEENAGLQRVDAAVYLTSVGGGGADGGGNSTGGGDGGGGVGGNGDGSEDRPSGWRRRSRDFYRRAGTGLRMSAIQRASASADGNSAAAAGGVAPPGLTQQPLPDHASLFNPLQQQSQPAGTNGGRGDDDGGDVQAPTIGYATEPQSPALTTAAAAVVRFLWPAASIPSGHRMGPRGASTGLEVGPELQLDRGRGGLAPQLPGQVMDDADDCAPEPPEPPPPDHTPFLLRPLTGAASTAASQEVSWWLMASHESMEGGSHEAGGLRRRRRDWQRGNTSSGEAGGGGEGGSSGSAPATALPALAAVRAAAMAAKWRNRAQLRERERQQPERVPWHTLALDLWGTADRYLPLFQPSRARASWDVLMLALLLYTSAVVPLQVGFRSIRQPALDYVDFAVLAVFWVDILVQFRTVYINETGEVVRNTQYIAAHYARTWLPLDLTSSLPWAEIIRALLGGRSSNSAGGLVTLLRVVRLLKLVRLLRVLDSLRYANLIRLGRLFMLMLLVAHWTACVWHGMSEWFETWPWVFDQLRLRNEHGFLAHYSHALYVSFVVVVGSDNLPTANNLERVFCIVMLIVGAVLYALIVSNMAVLAANLNSLSSRYRLKAVMAADALRYVGAPQAFRDRVADYYAFLAQHEHPGPEADAFLSELPRGLVDDIKWSLYSAPFHRMPLFAGCDEPFLAALQARLTLVAFTPGEVIFAEGEAGQHMYIVRKGCVLLRSPAGDMSALLRPGEAFGELALLPDLAARRRVCTAVAGQSTDLVALAARDLAAACKDHPQSAALVQERLMQQLEDHLEGTQWTWFIEKVLVPYQLYGDVDERQKPLSANGRGGHTKNGNSGRGVSFSSSCQNQELSFNSSMAPQAQTEIEAIDDITEARTAPDATPATSNPRIEPAASFSLMPNPPDGSASQLSTASIFRTASARTVEDSAQEASAVLAEKENDACTTEETGLRAPSAMPPPSKPSSPRLEPPCATPEEPGPPAAAVRSNSNGIVAALPSPTPSESLLALFLTPEPKAGARKGPAPALSPAILHLPGTEPTSAVALIDSEPWLDHISTAETPGAAAAAFMEATADVCGPGGWPTSQHRGPGSPTRPSRLSRPSHPGSPHLHSPASSGSASPIPSELLRLETATTTASADRRLSIEVEPSGAGRDGSGHARAERQGHYADLLGSLLSREERQQQQHRLRLRRQDGQQPPTPTPPTQAPAPAQPPAPQQPQQLRLPSAQRVLEFNDSMSSSRRLLRNLSDLMGSLLDHLPGQHVLQRMRTLSQGRRASGGASTNTSAAQVEPAARLTDGGGGAAANPVTAEHDGGDHQHRNNGSNTSTSRQTHTAGGSASPPLARPPGRRRLSSHEASAFLRYMNRDGAGGGTEDAASTEDVMSGALGMGGTAAAADGRPSPSSGAKQAPLHQAVRTAGQWTRRTDEGGLPASAVAAVAGAGAGSPGAAAAAAGEPWHGIGRQASRRPARRTASQLMLGRSVLGPGTPEDDTSNSSREHGGGGGGGRSSDFGGAVGYLAVTSAAHHKMEANSSDGRGGIRSLMLWRRSARGMLGDSGRWLSGAGAMSHLMAARASRDAADILAAAAATVTPTSSPHTMHGGDLLADTAGCGSRSSIDGVSCTLGGHLSRSVSGARSRPISDHLDPRTQLQSALTILAHAMELDLPQAPHAGPSTATVAPRAVLRSAGGSHRCSRDGEAYPQGKGQGSCAANTAAAPAAAGPATAVEVLFSQLGSRQLLVALADAVVRREGCGVPAVQEMLLQHGKEVLAGAEGRIGRVLESLTEGIEAIEQTVACLDESLHAANRRLAAIERDAMEAHGEGVLAGGLLGCLSREAFGGGCCIDDEDDDAPYGADGVGNGDERLPPSGGGRCASATGAAASETDPLAAAMLLLRPLSHGASSRKAASGALRSSQSGADGPVTNSFSTSSLRDGEGEGQQSAGGGAGGGADGGGGLTLGRRGSKGAAQSAGGGGSGSASRAWFRRTSAPAFSSNAGTSGSHRAMDEREPVFDSKGSNSLRTLVSAASGGHGCSGNEGSVHGHNAWNGGTEGSIHGRSGSSGGVVADGTAAAGPPPCGNYASRRKSLDAVGFSRLQQEWQSTPQQSLSHSCSAGAVSTATSFSTAAAAGSAGGGDGDSGVAAASAVSAAACANGGLPARERRRSKPATDPAGNADVAAAVVAAPGAQGQAGASAEACMVASMQPREGQAHGPRGRRASLMMLQAGMLFPDTAAASVPGSQTSPKASPLSVHVAGVRQRRAPYVAVLDDSIVSDGGPASASGAGRHAAPVLSPSERPGARRKATSPRQQQQLLQQQRPRHRSNTVDGLSVASSAPSSTRRNSNTLPGAVGKVASALASLRAKSRMSGGGLGSSASAEPLVDRSSGGAAGSQTGSQRASRAGDSQATSRRASVASGTEGEGHERGSGGGVWAEEAG